MTTLSFERRKKLLLNYVRESGGSVLLHRMTWGVAESLEDDIRIDLGKPTGQNKAFRKATLIVRFNERKKTCS